MIDKIGRILKDNKDFEKSVDWGELALVHNFSKSKLTAYPWKTVKQLYFYGTVGRVDYTAKSHGYNEVFGATANDRTQIAVFGADYELIKEILSLCGNKLEELVIVFTDCGSIRISHLTGLRRIYINHNHGLRLFGLSELTELRDISVTNAEIGEVLDLRGADKLVYLVLDRVPVSRIILDRDLIYVDRVYLYHTQIADYRFLKHITGIRSLNLAGENVTNLDNVELPGTITRFTLILTPIKRLPDSLRGLNNLKHVTLYGLHLDTLPDWLPELGLSYHNNAFKEFFMYDTTVADMDMSLFDQPDEVINEFFRSRAASRAQTPSPLNEAKIIFLGDGGAGKSHIIQRLLHDGELPPDFDGEATPGIAIDDRYYERDGRKIQVHYWDFGGQEILHSMHRMFLTKDTLYVVVVNARDNTQDERARYWLHNIKSFAAGSPVLLALNQIDQNESASINEKSLRTLYPELTRVVKLSAKCFDNERFNAAITEPLLDELFAMKILDEPFLPAWNMLKSSLREMREYYINEASFLQKCDECGVGEGLALRNGLLKWFNELGISFCYSDNPELSDYMVLRPDWITNAIYTILFNSHGRSENGLIGKRGIYSILHPTGEDSERIKTVNRDMRYAIGDVNYVLGVTREFHLSYSFDSDTEFIPMLCDRDEKPVANEYANDESTLELQMRYSYLPNNVIHRLMVELRRQLDIDNVWLTGALFTQPEMGLSAVVKSEDNVLKMYVRGENDIYSANTYLGDIKNTVEGINRKLGLTSISYIVYKNDGLSDEFKYDMIVKSKNRGNPSVYSEVFDDNISLDSILDKSVKPEDEKWRSLRDCVLRACASLQSNKKYNDASEDERNTYVRDIVRERFTFADQSLYGWSATGKSAGRPDGVIFDEHGTAFSVYEGLNVSSSSRSAKKNWNDHLDKLIANYNPSGLKRLFLVSYVKSDQFLELWNSFCGHMSAYTPEGYTLKRRIPGYTEANNLKYTECVYAKDGGETGVYCVFVSMGG